jgi:uracil-DNA glycosylase family 4
MDAKKQLNEIRQQVSECKKCKLHVTRNRAVPGEGPAESEVMFIGEGPGFNENEQGKPFVGQAGKFLDELLGYAGLSRERVYITNVVKCRPPGNRDPELEELATCRPYLETQMGIIDPPVIVTLGRFSMAHFILDGKISVIHGKPVTIKSKLIVPMYHPAAALHQPALKSVLIEDFKKLPGIIERGLKELDDKNKELFQAKSLDKPEDKISEATQLSLF